MKSDRQIQKQTDDQVAEILIGVTTMAEERQWSNTAGWQALGTMAAALFHSEAEQHMTPADEVRREFLRYIGGQMDLIQRARITLSH